MQHDHVLKKLNFDLLTRPGTSVCVWGSADKIFATMLLHFVIPFNLICNMTMFWKRWILTYCPIPRVLGEGVCGQNIFYHVAVFVILFNLICTVTIFWKSWTLTYWPHPQGRDDSGQNIFYHVVAFVIFFNLIYNVTMFWKSWPLTKWLQSQGSGVG